MRLPLPSLFFFFPPHQKALNQFHALQMLFTLLGVKHLLFAPLGFLSFFLLADSLRLFFFFSSFEKRRLYKDACCRPAPGVRTVDCPRRASPKKKTEKNRAGAHSLPAFDGEGRGDALLFISPAVANCAAICFLYSAITGRACYVPLSVFLVFFFLSRGNLFLRSEETLPSITIHAICKSFMKHPYFSGTSNRPNEKPSPARSRASHFHFSPLVTATVPGAVGFKVILKRPIITDTPRGFHAAPR